MPRSGKMRCGMGIYYPDSYQASESISLYSCSTNNMAELCAILYVMCTVEDKVDLVIHTDSMYSINCITMWVPSWESNGWSTAKGEPVKNANVLMDIVRIKRIRDSMGSVTQFIHVKGHTGDPGNEAADALARLGAEEDHPSYKLEMLTRSGIMFPKSSNSVGDDTCLLR